MGILSKDSPERQKYLKLKSEGSKKDPNPMVMYELGLCYADGTGTDKDLKRAFGSFLNAGEKDIDIAQFRVGKCYAEGLGTAKDIQKAANWYKKSSILGNIEARNALALLSSAVPPTGQNSKSPNGKLSRHHEAQNSSVDEEVVQETIKDGGKIANSIYKVKSKFKIKIKKVYCSSKEYDQESAIFDILGHLFAEGTCKEKEWFLECYDQFPMNQTIYFEFCDISLHTFYESTAKKLPEGREQFMLTALKTQIIPALKFLHELNIFHNDIKANNILGKKNDGYYFGIELEEPGYYRAPEVARSIKSTGKFIAADAIDIWALGCMIGDLLTNLSFYKSVEEDPRFLDVKVPVNFRGIHDNFSSFLKKLMAKEPISRITASQCLTATLFQVHDTKGVAAHGNALNSEKLDRVANLAEMIYSSLETFLPAIQENLKLLISDAKIPPVTFVILPIKNSFSLTDKFYKKYKINFICEYGEGHHLVGGEDFGYEMKEFSKVSKGLMVGAQVLLSAAVTALAPGAGNMINGAISQFLPNLGSHSSALLDNLQNSSQELSKEIKSWNLNSTDYSKLEKESSDAMKEFVKMFLEGKDLSKLGVSKADRANGTVCWLCEAHYKNEDVVFKPVPISMHGKAESSASSFVPPVAKEPELPTKSPTKIENQSLIDFWGDSGSALEWQDFFALITVVMKINKETQYLNTQLLRERCGDIANSLPALKLTLFKKVVGLQPIEEFFKEFIVDKRIEAEEAKKKEQEANQKLIDIKTRKINSEFLKILPASWDTLSNDSVNLHLTGDFNVSLVCEFFNHPVTQNLKILSLSTVKLNGEIPKEIGLLVNLTYLDLSNNELVGNIPGEIGQFLLLKNLQLQRNRLQGAFPSDVGKLINLQYFDISSNQITSFESYSIYKNVLKANIEDNKINYFKDISIRSIDQDEQNLAFNFFMKFGCGEQHFTLTNLGSCYQFGIGTCKDFSKALKCFEDAEKYGNSEAQRKLGVFYEYGTGVPKDDKKAFEWYLKAAEKANARAHFNLGQCYEYGTGITKDEKTAFEWYLKVAEQGNADAQFKLGQCYEYGTGVTKDEKKAFEWYLKAAEKGCAFAQFNLSFCYDYGTGEGADSPFRLWLERTAGRRFQIQVKFEDT